MMSLKFLKNLKIGGKLNIGFGILVVLTLLVVGLSYFASNAATVRINRTDDLRVPTALISARAQADLLRMLSDVRGYLALGELEYQESYNLAKDDFEADLEKLQQLSSSFDPENQRRLTELTAAFEEWKDLPDPLFALRNDQLEREPAYQILVIDGIQLGGTVLIELNTMIEAQGQREATPENIALLADMANFQGSFASMLSGLRGYVTTRNRTFKGEYEANLTLNEFAWDRLRSKRDLLTSSQQASLDKIAENREAFLQLPEQMFEKLESDRWREDLYLFSNEAVPVASQMLDLLGEITADQQRLLQADLNTGRTELADARWQTLVGGLVALVLGGVMAFVFRENIAGPVRRLTGVAEQIREGDLEARAVVESGDEIGTLAETFNEMTGQLRQTLLQVQKEKKRADDLLDVVIPIGVELASEKDFNRLLESMLLEAKSFCHADAGVLYLRTEDDRLEFVIVRNDTLGINMGGTSGQAVTFAQLMVPLPLYDQATGEPNHDTIATHVALTGQSLNIADSSQVTEPRLADLKVFSDSAGYQAKSYLTIPLKNSADYVIGVLQLINAQDVDTGQIIAFDQNLQRMMESFSSLAVAALEAYIREQKLKQEIQQLRIKIDEVKRQKQVEEITETDFFQELKEKATEIRRRGRHRRDKPGESES